MRKNKRFSVWVAAGGVLTAIILLGVGVAVIFSLRSSDFGEANPTAIMTLIPAPTTTPLIIYNPVSTPLSDPISSTPLPGTFGIGAFVQIFGTGGDGLRLRSDAGTTQPVLFLGYESEVFKIKEGPKEADGYIWWNLTAPYDATRSGWAAENYLQVVEVNP